MRLSTPPLVTGEVHVWIAPAAHERIFDVCRELLSDEDQTDIARLVLERDRRIATVSRGLRRLLLAGYLEKRPGSLRFSKGEHGKPVLVNSSSVRFSTSHAGDLVAIAIARKREVGIDIEAIRTRRGRSAVAMHFLSHVERRRLEALARERRDAAFHRCWVQKEAFVKLVGAGLQIPLDAFDVEVNPERPPGLRGNRLAAASAKPCVITEMSLQVGYVGMLAVFGPTPVVREFSVTPLYFMASLAMASFATGRHRRRRFQTASPDPPAAWRL